MINNRQRFTRVIIIFILIAFWFIASLFFNNTYSFTSLVYPYSKAQLIQIPAGKLLKGEKIVGKFTAKDNYLGMVTLRFNANANSGSAGEDMINFRIKEQTSPTWYYSSNYGSNAVVTRPNFPFGFPVIENSQNKNYEFEITSISGNSNNAVALDASDPEFAAVHKFTKTSIFNNGRSVLHFMVMKIITSYANVEFLLRSIPYLIPLFFYVVIKWGSRMKVPLPVIVLFLIFLDILFLQEVYGGILLVLSLGWIWSIKQYYIDSKSSFFVAGLLLLIWIPLIYADKQYIQNKLNIWVYYFFVIGTMQLIIEEKYPKAKRFSIIDIIQHVIDDHENI
jgi:hypothetical protein